MKILIIVESYWGAGHMNVAAEAAQALTLEGHQVFIAASARSFELGATFEYGNAQKIIFPNILKDEHNRYIIAPSGLPLRQDPDTVTQTRLDILKQAHETFGFDRAIFEEWPFGVNDFDHCFTAFADYLTSQNIPLDGIVRDVLGYPEPRHNDPRHHDLTAVTLSNLYLHSLYIASDEKIVTLPQSLHPDAAPYLSRYNQHYVGYFGAHAMPPKKRMAKTKRPIIIASGGSFKGAVRGHFLQIISGLAAFLPHSDMAQNPLKIIIGTEAQDDDIQTLSHITAHLPQTQILKSLPSHEFRAEIANCAVLVHKGGLNIAIDALQARTKSIFTPMHDPHNGTWAETDIRAQAFTRARYAKTLTINDITNPTKLQDAFNQRLTRKKPNLNGAQNMAALITTKPRP